MSKITLSNVTTFQNDTSAVAAINSNNSTTQAAFDNTLSRDGTAPNQMLSTLDMNGQRIINLPSPVNNSEPLRLQDLVTIQSLQTTTPGNLPVGGTVGQFLIKNSGINFDASWQTSTIPVINTFNTRAIAAAATIPAGVGFLTTGGFSTLNDGGAARYQRVAGSTIGGFQSADLQWWALDESVRVPEMYGAKGDGSTNDTVAMQNWLDGSTMRRLPPKVYIVNGTTGACLTWSNAGLIFGDRMLSTIRAAATCPATVNVINLVPSVANFFNQGYTARDFNIDVASSGAAKHGIEIPAATSTAQITSSLFDNLQIGSQVTGRGFQNGNAIHQTGDPSYGGLYYTTFSNLLITSGGINFQNCGDSVYIRNCLINGYYGNTPYVGIKINLIVGAGGPFIEDCNITSVGTFAEDAAGISLSNALGGCIRGCEVEWNAAAGIANKMILLNNCVGTTIDGGFISANGTSAGCIRMMAGTTRTVIRGVVMTIGGAAIRAHYILDSGVKDNFFEHSNRYGNNGVITEIPAVSAAGNNTPNFGLFIGQVPLTNPWQPWSDTLYRQGLFATKLATGQVVLAGALTGGSTTAGTIMATLPIELVATKFVRICPAVFNGTTWSTGVVRIDLSGNVIVEQLAGNTIVQFDNCTFMAL